MRLANEIITQQIPIQTLVGLLDSMTPIENQRITAQMTAAVPPDDDAAEDDDEPAQIVSSPPPGENHDLVIRFVRTSMPDLTVSAPDPEPERPLPSWAIVTASAAFTLLLAGLAVLAA